MDGSRVIPITGWSACARCVNGDAAGLTCRAPQVRVIFALPILRTDRARLPNACGPDGRWHVYQPARAEAPALP